MSEAAGRSINGEAIFLGDARSKVVYGRECVGRGTNELVGSEILLSSASLKESCIAVLLARVNGQPDVVRRIRSFVDVIDISSALQIHGLSTHRRTKTQEKR